MVLKVGGVHANDGDINHQRVQPLFFEGIYIHTYFVRMNIAQLASISFSFIWKGRASVHMNSPSWPFPVAAPAHAAAATAAM